MSVSIAELVQPLLYEGEPEINCLRALLSLMSRAKGPLSSPHRHTSTVDNLIPFAHRFKEETLRKHERRWVIISILAYYARDEYTSYSQRGAVDW